MREIYGDILDMKDGLIFQCVNTLGVMGAGLALQTKKRFPHVYNNYISRAKGQDTMLGKAVLIPSNFSSSAFVLLFTQSTIGRSGRHTNMDALNAALCESQAMIARTRPCYFPYMMGCGLGGGDWTRVYQLIQHYFPDGIIVRRK